MQSTESGVMTLPQEPNGESLETMSFGDHLEELRTRLIRSLLVLLVFAGVALVYQSELMTIVTAPHRKAMLQIESSRVTDTLNGEISEIVDLVSKIDVETAQQCLSQAVSRGDWWQRWDRFKSEAPNEGPISELILLVEDRAEFLDGALKSGDPLLRVPRSLEYSIELLSQIANTGKVSWGGRSTVEGLGERLQTVFDYWEIAQGEVPEEPMGEKELGAAVKPPATPEELATAETELREIAQRIELVETRLVDWSGWYEKGRPLVLLAYTEAFFAYIKLGLFLGLICSLPWITAETWQFIAAGLYPRERKSVRPFLPVAFLLLGAGVNFAYWILVPVGLSFLGGYGDPALLAASFTLKDYMGLVFTLVLGMGLIFQLPLLMTLLTRSGIVDVSFFREYRKVSIMTAVIFGALLTPPDVVTQLLMAGPLVILYEVGILASVILGRSGNGENETDVQS